MELLTLPMPPTLNNFYGFNGHKRYVRKEGKEYKEIVNVIIKERGWNFYANVRLSVEIVMNFGNKRVNDLDNRLKCLLDALSSANVWDDDGLIDDLHIRRGKDTGKPSVMITIIAMEDLKE